MSLTRKADVQEQVQTYWSDIAMDELRVSTLLPGLVNKDYKGEIKNKGDTVKIFQVNAPAGQLRTVGVDADVFTSEKMSTSSVSLVADRIAIESFELEDLVELQSQIQIEQNGGPASSIRGALVHAVEKKINQHCYSLVAPSTSAPDHLITSVTDFNAAKLGDSRMLAGAAKWSKAKEWYALVDPQYHLDLLNAQTIVSKDYVGDDTPVVAGQIGNKRFNFNIFEDNSLAVDQGLLFHPDFMLLAMQKEMTFEISRLHANKQLGWLISAHVVFGAKLGIDGDKKHILNTAGSTSTVVLS